MDLNNKTVLVTGAAGFIGSKVCELLMQENCKIVAIDNINNYYDQTVKLYRLAALAGIKNWTPDMLFNCCFINNNMSFHKTDIEDVHSLKQLFETHNFDVVYHLAARAGVQPSLKNPQDYITTNAIGTTNLLSCMKEYGTKKIVLASTSSLYAGQKMPFTEDLPVNTPLSPYAASKKAAELMAHSYHHLFNLDVSIVRFFTVFGPAGRPDMSIFRFIKWIDENKPVEIFGDGSQSRDFTFITDIAKGTIKAAKEVGYEIFNLGGGRDPKDLNWTIDFICKYRNLPLPYRGTKEFHAADIQQTQADISKAKKILGYVPEVSFEEGLIKTLDWHAENNWWLKNVVV
jgi:nucleoside-diphosphate-sugar epimerase